jgi:hypothetical protein
VVEAAGHAADGYDVFLVSREQTMDILGLLERSTK